MRKEDGGHVFQGRFKSNLIERKEIRDRYGDWGKDMVLYLARKKSGMTRAQIGEKVFGTWGPSAAPVIIILGPEEGAML